MNVDRSWFDKRMAAQGVSLSEVARRMQIDKSALSRALSGKRGMKVAEIAKISTILKASEMEVFAHLKAKVAATPTTHGDAEQLHGGMDDHPGFGFMKGQIKIAEGFDITKPFDDEPWDEGYLGSDDRK